MANLFASGDELRDVLVPFFKAGLENNERCLWVTGAAFDAEAARSALRAAVPDLDTRERTGQIEIFEGQAWYAGGEPLRAADLVNSALRREEDALDRGYAGFRTSGNCAWVSHATWPLFLSVERHLQTAKRGRRMICLCSYCVEQLPDISHVEIMGCHDVVMPSTCPPARHISKFEAADRKPLRATRADAGQSPRR
jgi:hypothetical protein